MKKDNASFFPLRSSIDHYYLGSSLDSLVEKMVSSCSLSKNYKMGFSHVSARYGPHFMVGLHGCLGQVGILTFHFSVLFMPFLDCSFGLSIMDL